MRTVKGRDAHFSRSRSGPGVGGLRRSEFFFCFRGPVPVFAGSTSPRAFLLAGGRLAGGAFRLLESTLQIALASLQMALPLRLNSAAAFDPLLSPPRASVASCPLAAAAKSFFSFSFRSSSPFLISVLPVAAAVNSGWMVRSGRARRLQRLAAQRLSRGSGARACRGCRERFPDA